MVALREVWRRQRQQRQQEAVQRQQQVRQELDSIRQELQEQALQLRQELGEFRDELASRDRDRRQEAILDKATLQQFHWGLHQQVRAFLVQASHDRQSQAAQLTQFLEAYVAAVQKQTAQWLTLAGIERLLMSQELTQNLQTFHVDLVNTVNLLRQEYQDELEILRSEVQTLQASTQAELGELSRQRLALKAQLIVTLTDFKATLQADVQDTLAEFSALRQERAEALQQALAQSHQARSSQVQALFQHLAEFRGELQRYHANLQHTVVGTQASLPPTTNGVAPKATKTAPGAKAPTRLGRAVASKPTRPIATAKGRSMPASVPSTVQASMAPVTAVKPAVAMNGSSPTLKATSISPEILTADSSLADIEKTVYNYIYLHKGARLVEIESAVGINRFQAVDALRSLIKKGLIFQRDRVYLIEEDPTL